MHHAIRLLIGIIAVSAMTACSALFHIEGASGSGSVPMNSGTRLDLVIGDATPRDLTSLIRSEWIRSDRLSSWFLVLDRVVTPDETMILEADFRGISRNSQRVGTPKYGYSMIYSSTAEIVFSLVDLRSGVVVASAAGRGSVSSENSRDLDEAAKRRAVAAGLNRLMASYTGGS